MKCITQSHVRTFSVLDEPKSFIPQNIFYCGPLSPRGEIPGEAVNQSFVLRLHKITKITTNQNTPEHKADPEYLDKGP
jgi:hypothetical protein